MLTLSGKEEKTSSNNSDIIGHRIKNANTLNTLSEIPLMSMWSLGYTHSAWIFLINGNSKVCSILQRWWLRWDIFT